MSQTLKGGLKHDTRALGKNTKKYFDLWDLNKNGQIDVQEVDWGPFYSSVKCNLASAWKRGLVWTCDDWKKLA